MDKTEGRSSSRASGSRVARSSLSGAVTPNLPVNAKSLWQKTEKTGDWLEDLKARLTNTKFVVEEEGPTSSAEPATANERRAKEQRREDFLISSQQPSQPMSFAGAPSSQVTTSPLGVRPGSTTTFVQDERQAEKKRESRSGSASRKEGHHDRHNPLRGFTSFLVPAADTRRRTGKPLHVPNRWSSAFDAKPSKGAADLPTLFRMVEGLDLQKTAPRVEEIVEELKATRLSRGGRSKGKPPARTSPFVGTVPAPATIEKLESSFLAACDVIGVVCELLGNAGAFCKLLRKLEFLLLDAVASLRKGMVDVEDDDGGSASRSLFEALPAEVLDVFCEQLHGALRGVADVLKMQDDSLARLRSDSEKQHQQGEGSVDAPAPAIPHPDANRYRFYYRRVLILLLDLYDAYAILESQSTIENQKTSDKDQQLPLVPEGADGREENRGLQAGLPDATASADPRDKQSKIASAAEREIEIILADLQDRFEAFKDVWYGLESTVSDHVVSMYETFVHMLLQTYDIVKIHGTGELLDHQEAEPGVDTTGPGRGSGIVVPPPPRPPGPSWATRGSAEVVDAGNVAGPTSRKNRARVSVDLSRIAGECFAEKGGPGQRNRKRDAGRHPTEAPPLLEDELVAQKFLTAIDKALFRECRHSGDDVVAERRQPPGAVGRGVGGGSWKIMDDASGADEEKGGGAAGGYRDEDSLSGSSDAFSDEEAERRKNPDYLTRDDFGFRSPLRKSAIEPYNNNSVSGRRRSYAFGRKCTLAAMKRRAAQAKSNTHRVRLLANVEDIRQKVRRLMFFLRSLELRRSRLLRDPKEEIALRERKLRNCLQLTASSVEEQKSAVSDTSQTKSRQLALDGADYVQKSMRAHVAKQALLLLSAGGADSNASGVAPGAGSAPSTTAAQASVSAAGINTAGRRDDNFWATLNKTSIPLLQEASQASIELHYVSDLRKFTTARWWRSVGDDAFLVLDTCLFLEKLEESSELHRALALLRRYLLLEGCTKRARTEVVQGQAADDALRNVGANVIEDTTGSTPISVLLHWFSASDVPSLPNATIEHSLRVLEEELVSDRRRSALSAEERHQCRRAISSLRELHGFWRVCFAVSSSPQHEQSEKQDLVDLEVPLLQQLERAQCSAGLSLASSILHLDRNYNANCGVHSSRRAEGADVEGGYRSFGNHDLLQQYWKTFLKLHAFATDKQLLLERDKQRHMQKFGYTEEEHEMVLAELAEIYSSGQESSGDEESILGDVAGEPRGNVTRRTPTARSTGGPPDEVAEGDEDVRDSETQRIAGDLSRLASAQKEVRVDFRYRRKKRNFVNSVEYEGKTGRRTKQTLDLALSRLLQKSVGAEMRAKIMRNTGVDTKRDFERIDSADEDDIQLTSDIRNCLMRQAPKLRDRRHVAAGARALAEGASGVSEDPRDLRRFHLLAPVVSVLEYLRWLASKVDPNARPTASQEAEEKRAASAGRPRNKGLCCPEERQQARHDAKYFVNCDRPGSMPTSPSNCSPVGSPAAGLGRIHGDALVPEDASSLFWPQPINSSAQSETTRMQQHALSRTGYPAGANTVKLVRRTTVYLDKTRSSSGGKSGPGASYRESLDQAVGAAVSDAKLRKKALLSRALQRSKERSHENARNLARVRRHHEVLLGAITEKDFGDHRGRSGMDEQGAAQPRSQGRASDVVYPPKETTTFDHTDLAAIDRLSAELSRLEAQEAEEKKYRESLRKSRDKNESRDTVAAAAEGGGEGEVEGRGLTSTSKMPGVGVYGLPEFDEEVGDKSKKKSSKLPNKTKNSKIVDDLQADEGAPDVVVFVAKEAVDLARASVVPAGGAQEKVRESEGGALKKRTLALSTRDSSAAFDLLGHTSPGGGRGQDDRDRTDESRSRRSRTETMTGAERDILPAERTPTSRTPAHSSGVGSVDVLGRGVRGGAADRGGVLRLQNNEAASQKEHTSTSGGAKGSSRSSKTGGGRETLAGAAARPREDGSREAEAEDIARGRHPGPRIASERVPGAAGDAHHPKISGLDVEALGRADFDRYLREQGLLLQDWIPHLDQVVAPTGKSSSSAGGADADAERTRGATQVQGPPPTHARDSSPSSGERSPARVLAGGGVPVSVTIPCADGGDHPLTHTDTDYAKDVVVKNKRASTAGGATAIPERLEKDERLVTTEAKGELGKPDPRMSKSGGGRTSTEADAERKPLGKPDPRMSRSGGGRTSTEAGREPLGEHSPPGSPPLPPLRERSPEMKDVLGDPDLAKYVHRLKTAPLPPVPSMSRDTHSKVTVVNQRNTGGKRSVGTSKPGDLAEDTHAGEQEGATADPHNLVSDSQPPSNSVGVEVDPQLAADAAALALDAEDQGDHHFLQEYMSRIAVEQDVDDEYASERTQSESALEFSESEEGKLKREAAEEVQVAMARIVGEEDLEGGPLMYGRDAKSLPDSLASSERLSREEGPGSSAGGVSLAESESDEGGDRRVQLNTFTVNTSGKEESWLMERAEGFDVYQLEHVYDGDAQVRERSFYFVGVRPPHGWTPRLSKEVFLYYNYREGGGERNSADTAEPAASASKKSINEFSATARHRSAFSPEHSELQFDRWWRRMFAYVVEHNKDVLTDEKFFAQAGAEYDVIVTKRIVLVFVMNLAKILLRRGELFFDTHPEFVVEEGLGKAVKGVSKGSLVSSSSSSTSSSGSSSSSSSGQGSNSSSSSGSSSASSSTEFSSLDDVFVLPPRVVYRSFLKQVRLQAEEEGHKRHKRSNEDEMNRTKNNTSTAPAQAHERDKNESDEDSSSQEPNPKTSARRACALQNLRELEKTRLCGKSWDLWEIVNAFENLYPDEANLLVQRLEQLGREISNLLFMAGRGRGRRGGKSTAQGARSREGSTPLALTPRRKIQIPPTQQSRSPSPSASPEQLSQQQSDRQAPIMTNKTAAMAAGKRIEGAHAVAPALPQNLEVASLSWSMDKNAAPKRDKAALIQPNRSERAASSTSALLFMPEAEQGVADLPAAATPAAPSPLSSSTPIKRFSPSPRSGVREKQKLARKTGDLVVVRSQTASRGSASPPCPGQDEGGAGAIPVPKQVDAGTTSNTDGALPEETTFSSNVGEVALPAGVGVQLAGGAPTPAAGSGDAVASSLPVLHLEQTAPAAKSPTVSSTTTTNERAGRAVVQPQRNFKGSPTGEGGPVAADNPSTSPGAGGILALARQIGRAQGKRRSMNHELQPGGEKVRLKHASATATAAAESATTVRALTAHFAPSGRAVATGATKKAAEVKEPVAAPADCSASAALPAKASVTGVDIVTSGNHNQEVGGVEVYTNLPGKEDAVQLERAVPTSVLQRMRKRDGAFVVGKDQDEAHSVRWGTGVKKSLPG